jgi:hypothetical protein
MAFTGDFDGLHTKIEGLAEVSHFGMKRAVAAAQDEAESQYESGFNSQRSPWGEVWPALKGGGRALQFTGALQGAATTASANAIQIKPPRYWVFHQVGGRLPKRPVLPFSASNWDDPIQREIEDAILGLIR